MRSVIKSTDLISDTVFCSIAPHVITVTKEMTMGLEGGGCENLHCIHFLTSVKWRARMTTQMFDCAVVESDALQFSLFTVNNWLGMLEEK